jgi:hypothetical protein
LDLAAFAAREADLLAALEADAALDAAADAERAADALAELLAARADRLDALLALRWYLLVAIIYIVNKKKLFTPNFICIMPPHFIFFVDMK